MSDNLDSENKRAVIPTRKPRRVVDDDDDNLFDRAPSDITPPDIEVFKPEPTDECLLCTETYDDNNRPKWGARIFNPESDCAHEFCLPCVQQMGQNGLGTCPMCRRDVKDDLFQGIEFKEKEVFIPDDDTRAINTSDNLYMTIIDRARAERPPRPDRLERLVELNYNNTALTQLFRALMSDGNSLRTINSTTMPSPVTPNTSHIHFTSTDESNETLPNLSALLTALNMGTLTRH
jgi:hypothetical protein